MRELYRILYSVILAKDGIQSALANSSFAVANLMDSVFRRNDGMGKNDYEKRDV